MLDLRSVVRVYRAYSLIDMYCDEKGQLRGQNVLNISGELLA